MVPRPALTLTIPSISDDTVLDCRIYTPPNLLARLTTEGRGWRKKSAIVAHPYAPLGGCQDNPIVDVVVSCLVEEDFFVGTFNFRGAGGSKGRTSWTAKPETDDYTSFIGLMIYFMHYLSIPDCFYSKPQPSWDDKAYNLTPIPSHTLPPPQSPASPQSRKRSTLIAASVAQSWSLLLLAGYSYGALVTTRLPAVPSIISLFDKPELGSAEFEIVLRAKQLAKQQNDAFACIVESLKETSESSASNTTPKQSRGRSAQADLTASSRKPSATASVRVGGEETDPDARRASHDSHNHRSFSFEPERLRKSIDRVRSLARRPDFRNPVMPPERQGSTSSSHGSSGRSSPSVEIVSPLEVRSGDGQANGTEKENAAFSDIKVSYLLISPLQGLVTKLATMWSKTPRVKTKDLLKDQDCNYETEDKLVLNNTLAIYGDEDVFSTGKKLRLWAEKLNGEENSRFRHVEICGAGHFWLEEGVVDQMKASIQDFISGL